MYRQFRKEQQKTAMLSAVVAVLAGAVLILSVGLAYERGHNRGYDEGYNDGHAEGWAESIEENNLYGRYYYE